NENHHGKSNDKCGHDLPTSTSLTDSTNFLEQSPPYLASPIFSHKNSEDGEINYSGTKNSSHEDDADDICRYNDSNMEFVMDGEHDCSSGSEKFEKQLMESSPPKPLPEDEKNSIFGQICDFPVGGGGGDHDVAPSGCNSSSGNRLTVSTIGGPTSSSCGQYKTAAGAAAAHGAGNTTGCTIKNPSCKNNVS
ncbi:unnamed protein product, partial [Amoebophrya sp. A120]